MFAINMRVITSSSQNIIRLEFNQFSPLTVLNVVQRSLGEHHNKYKCVVKADTFSKDFRNIER